jgi:glutamyl-tRNA synthetase
LSLSSIPREAIFGFGAFVRELRQTDRVRFAPTPSGYLHEGNAFNFWLNHDLARRTGARVLLRIDDLDAARKRDEYVQDVFDSLEWLGLPWHEGPRSLSDFEANWSQVLRVRAAQDILDVLREKGLLFACAKSRADLAPYQGAYPEDFREQGLSLDAPDVAWRLKTPPGSPMPDFVVRRRDGMPAYQVMSVADDLHFHVTAVVRGDDLEASSWAQRYLARQADCNDFLDVDIWHHPLLLDEQGEKRSKSAGAASLRARRLAGERGSDLIAGFEAVWTC